MTSLTDEFLKEEIVVLVDESDCMTGLTDKMSAHREGLLHRAVSVLVFSSRGEWLLQQRAHHKYHSASLWSNACCTHPRPGEKPMEAASRRLREEIGLSTDLIFGFHFVYKAKIDSSMTEHEFDHVFYGFSDRTPVLNPREADDWKWIATEELKHCLSQKPEQFTAWFHIIFEYAQKYLPSWNVRSSERIV